METPAHLVDLNTLTDFMRTFRAGRNWEPFHTPKNVALAIDLNEATVAKMTANAERYPPAAPAS